MRRTVLVCTAFSAVLFVSTSVQEETLAAFFRAPLFASSEPLVYEPPLPPQAGVPETATEAADTSLPPETPPQETSFLAPTYHPPVRVTIPSVRINSPVIKVGINEKGEMDVPDGKTNYVGWYAEGTTPGEVGSAVLDAHVYAAFNKMRYVKPGDDIYVTDTEGKTLHFVVEEAKLTKLKDVSGYFLFERADRPRLNLITCAGKFDRRLNTYTHRLIVYAVLVE